MQRIVYTSQHGVQHGFRTGGNRGKKPFAGLQVVIAEGLVGELGGGRGRAFHTCRLCAVARQNVDVMGAVQLLGVVQRVFILP
ncbi:hypothetical protein Barb7_02602 [Bacteroidales bacterium Barb7]|nr:hypothetical protein Barb7_02602 [Bacteroidales bacterium Barb7]